MACNLTTLFGNVSCFQCVPPGQWQLLRLAMLCRIANGDTSVCDVATLLGEASCFQCLTPGEQPLIELALLCQIATNGGGGGGGSDQIKTFTADPNAEGVLPGNQNIGAIAYPVGGIGQSYEWDTVNKVWF